MLKFSICIFMILRVCFNTPTLLKIRAKYSVYFMCSISLIYTAVSIGLGLYYFLDHSLSPMVVIVGAYLFMLVSQPAHQNSIITH